MELESVSIIKTDVLEPELDGHLFCPLAPFSFSPFSGEDELLLETSCTPHACGGGVGSTDALEDLADSTVLGFTGPGCGVDWSRG